MRKPIVVRLHDKQVTERDPGHRPNPLQPVCDQRCGRFGQPLKLGIAVKATPFTVTGATRRDGGLTVAEEPIRGTERQGSEPSARSRLKLVDSGGRRRSEKRRAGTERGCACRYRWTPELEKNKRNTQG